MRLPNLNLSIYHSFDTHDLFHQTSQLLEEYLAIHLKYRDVPCNKFEIFHIQLFLYLDENTYNVCKCN